MSVLRIMTIPKPLPIKPGIIQHCHLFLALSFLFFRISERPPFFSHNHTVFVSIEPRQESWLFAFRRPHNDSSKLSPNNHNSINSNNIENVVVANADVYPEVMDTETHAGQLSHRRPSDMSDDRIPSSSLRTDRLFFCIYVFYSNE